MPMRTLLVLAHVSHRSARADLSVGFAEADVTPKLDAKKPVYIAGFGHNRKATKVHDPIMARAVVLSDGKQKIALVSRRCGRPLQRRRRDACASRSTGSPTSACRARTTTRGRTRSACGARARSVSGIDTDYMKDVEAGIVDGGQGRGQGPQAGDGEDRHRSPPRSCCTTAASRTSSTTSWWRSASRSADGKPVGVLVQWNCHPETMDSKNTELTADYVGYTVKRAEEEPGLPGGLLHRHRRRADDVARRAGQGRRRARN